MERDEASPAGEAVPGAPWPDANALAAALGVPVQTDGGARPTFRFRQRVAFAAELSRRGVLDLAARSFRSTLWAGEHRCLDHLELTDLEHCACDPVAGRLIVEGSGLRLVLTRQGTLSAVPAPTAAARTQRRTRPEATRPGPGHPPDQ